jgi:hypothetical protein
MLLLNVFTITTTIQHTIIIRTTKKIPRRSASTFSFVDGREDTRRRIFVVVVRDVS